jgi:hypothetical protein
MPDTPTTAPTAPGAPTTPAGGTVRVSVTPGAPAATPTATPPADPAATPPADLTTIDPSPDDDTFTSDRQRRRFAELTGRVGTRERERDEARARVEQLLTREAERIAGGTLSQPSDLWLDGARVADVLSDDGSDVDDAKVAAAVDALVAKRPGLKKPPVPQPLHGIHGVRTITEAPMTLADAVKRIAAGRGGM